MRLDIIGKVCRYCGGGGEIVVYSPPSGMVTNVERLKCPACHGVGRVPAGGGPAWTKEVPTEDGWWWVAFRPHDRPIVVQVTDTTDGMVSFREPGVSHTRYADANTGALWCGPVTPPEVPQDAGSPAAGQDG